MTTATPISHVPVPGSGHAGVWEVESNERVRLIYSDPRRVIDHDVLVQSGALQYDDGRIEEPRVILGEHDLNSDQARELASALLEVADEVDRWSVQ